MRNINCECVCENRKAISHISQMPHVLHFVISIVDKPFVVQGCIFSPLQDIIRLLLVVWNALNPRNRKSTVKEKPIAVNKHLHTILLIFFYLHACIIQAFEADMLPLAHIFSQNRPFLEQSSDFYSHHCNKTIHTVKYDSGVNRNERCLLWSH